MSDNYAKDNERAQKIAKGIDSDLKDREEAIAKKLSTAKLEAGIKASFRQLSSDIDVITRSFESYENNPSAYNLTTREIEKRRKLLTDIKAFHEQLKERFNVVIIPEGNVFSSSANRGGFDKDYDVNNLTTKDLVQVQKNMISEQDEQIEILTGVVGNIHRGQEVMRDELTYQNEELLPQLEKGIDQNTSKMIKVNKTLAKLLKSSSNCCLYIIILFQIACLFILIFDS